MGRVNDEIIDYFLNDPYYKNDVHRYRIIAINNLLVKLKLYQISAVKTYAAISDLLVINPSDDKLDYLIIPSDSLNKYTGVYEFQQGLNLTISLKDEQLSAQITGQPFFKIFPLKPDQFFASVVAANLNFTRDSTQNIDGFTLSQAGEASWFKKIK